MKRNSFFLVLFIIFASVISLPGQNKSLDSLLILLNKATHDSIRCKELINIGREYEKINTDSALKYFNIVYSVSEKQENTDEIFRYYKATSLSNKSWLEYAANANIKNALEYGFNAADQLNNLIKNSKNNQLVSMSKTRLGYCYNNIGVYYHSQGEMEKSLDYYLKSLEIRKEINDKKGMAQNYSNIGVLYRMYGIYDKSLEYLLKSLKIREELNLKEEIGGSYSNIGLVYYDQKSYEKALEFHNKALKIAVEMNNKKAMAMSYNNMGSAYSLMKQYDKSLENYKNSLNIYTDLKNKPGIAQLYNNIGYVYHSQGLYKEALDYYQKSLNSKQELGDINGIALVNSNIAELNIKIADSLGGSQAVQYLNDAVRFANKALTIARDIKLIPIVNSAAQNLMNAYKKLGHYKKALEYAELYIATKDSMFKEEKTKSIAIAEKKFEVEKKQLQIDKLNKEKELQQSELLRQQEAGRRQKLINAVVIIGIILIAVFAIFVVNRLRISRKQNKQIKAQRDEIETQRDLVTNQKDRIEKQKHQITDSINYAKRIQQAVLPGVDYASQILGEHFILFKPKDIVSGDFYWATRIKDHLIFTVADCTGHGVPGAFMSMLGVSFLNEIIRKKEVIKAAEVLDNLRDSIIEALQQKGHASEQKDGMDIAFCVLNTQSKLLQYAGAFNPLFIVSADKEMKIVSPDKQPVAIYENMKKFTNHETQLHKGDCLYLISDGFEDQFGGEKNKKFMIKYLKEMLVRISDKPMTEQHSILDKTFEEWKGNHEQIDDVTIMGLRIS